MNKVYTFTKKYNTVSRILTLPVKIRLAGTDGYYETQGIIDTGAIVSIVSKNIVKKLDVEPHSYQFMDTASEQKVITPVYRASIILGGQVEITNLMVGDGILPEDEECLIGMDILSLGDLAISHFEGKTCISFRIPSQESIELKEINKNV
jgi:predicted aspartyl protease